ncbi:phospholipase D-like domain-containing protein [Streptomyces sp. NBC_00846]|uniref:phospholipase D-like domain-containing protein n=1 Tax=Streptomyces sp. NBC_00846 TaxID=2975849 RepID=UPI0038633662|nr:phospholipase D-like domain-containing protein [Streptomyces sp. NBC_00846]
MKKSLSTLFVLLGLFVCTVVPSSAAEAAPVVTGVVFNNPRGTAKEQNAVKTHIISAIDQTPSGRPIRVALYVLNDQGYTDALKRAFARGVQVRVVLDSNSGNKPPAQDLIETLGTNMTKTSWVRVCSPGLACVSNAPASVNPIQHNKFFTFSRIGDAGVAEDVVIQASANQTTVNINRYWNNAYTVVGNTALYTAYANYFTDLANMKRTNDYHVQGAANDEKYYFFPRASGDPVLDFLNNVTCTGNSSVGSASHKTVIRVAASLFDRTAIADKLIALADADCWVEVVYADSPLTNRMKGDARLKLYHLQNSDGYQVHSKYLAIEGNYAGHPDTKWVFTGSHNLDKSSLRDNDEAIIRVSSNATHDAYRENFLLMRSYSVPSS